jgi:NAD+ diphosphatase
VTAVEPNAFTGASLDRVADERKDPAWVAEQAAHPSARAVLAGDAGVHLTADDPPRLALLPLADVRRDGDPVLLGVDENGPVFAVDAEPSGEAPRRLIGGAGARGRPAPGLPDAIPGEPSRPAGLRDAVAVLPRTDGGLVAYACAVLNWHRRHGHCSACGAPTDATAGGLVRTCPRCGTQHFPRTDPVVIMAIYDGRERLLLGRQSTWAPHRYSTLAGFVEAGETLEEAVAREVREEADLEIERPEYVSSQPWPFPSSLMLGFMAQWRSGEPHRQEQEIEDVRWFSRDEVAAAVAGDGALDLPDRYAIARRLIEGWLAT